MKKPKWAWFIAPAVCILLGVLLLLAARSIRESGHMKLAVADAYTEAPIEGAVIVLPEAGLNAVSDQNGIAYLYGVPLRQGNHTLSETVPRGYGETTILVYAEGYLPFALFHAHVYRDRMRSGPTLYLFPEGAEGGTRVISMIESPEEAWVERLLEMYAPY